MIKFSCKNCGQKICVEDTCPAKQGKCPKCKNIIVVPQLEKPETAGQDHNLIDLQLDTSATKTQKNSEQTCSDNDYFDTVQNIYNYGRTKITDDNEQACLRRFPWLVDIFLYPLSIPGLTILGIVIGIPLLLALLHKLFYLFTIVCRIGLIFLTITVALRVLFAIVLALYGYWYLCQCIRDSAAGRIRAPETISNTPTIGEMLAQLLKTIGCLAFFFAPLTLYYRYTKQVDIIFWLLFAYAVLLFPMSLLAVIMFDSFTGLRPRLVIGSIFGTFFQYFGMLLFFSIIITAMVLMVQPLQPGWLLRHFVKLVVVYIVMVMAHILGRFYWRYQEKLYWEV
jgi:hypothetical protein